MKQQFLPLGPIFIWVGKLFGIVIPDSIIHFASKSSTSRSWILFSCLRMSDCKTRVPTADARNAGTGSRELTEESIRSRWRLLKAFEMSSFTKTESGSIYVRNRRDACTTASAPPSIATPSSFGVKHGVTIGTE